MNWLLQYRHGDVNYSIGSIVNNIIITVYGVRWILLNRLMEVNHFVNYINIA